MNRYIVIFESKKEEGISNSVEVYSNSINDAERSLYAVTRDTNIIGILPQSDVPEEHDTHQ